MIKPGVGVGVTMGIRHQNVALSATLLSITKLSFSSGVVMEPDHPPNEHPLAGCAETVIDVPSSYVPSRLACGETTIFPAVGSTGSIFSVRLGAGVGVTVAVAVADAVGDGVGESIGDGVDVADGRSTGIAVAVASGVTADAG